MRCLALGGDEMAEVKRGRQTPTNAVVIPYESTKGQEAVDLYNKTERTAQEWQELLLYDIMAVNDDGLWVHTKYGYSVPRRNGKNEVVAMREAWAFLNGEKVLHTAHRTPTSHSAWERLVTIISKAGFVEGEDFKTHKQFGLESIEWINKDRPGKVNFRTRSSKGGLGEGFDLLVIDEAQEYTDDQESALKYVVSDSMNPQTLFCGTPPTPVSSGTVFTKLRRDILAGDRANSGWAEWSVPFKSDIHDVSLWYETNPSMGLILNERKVADEISTDEDDFNIQRLGLWIQYNQKSAISRTEWEELKLAEKPTLVGKPFVGIKYGHDGNNVAMSVAVKTAEGQIFVESIDCQSIRNGTDWIVQYLSAMKPKSVVIDGQNGQRLLADELKKEGIKNLLLPTVKDVIVANASFEQGIFQKNLAHFGQPSLEQAVTNCEKRAIGSNGGFGYRALKDGIDIALLDSLALAYWSCEQNKEKPKQQINY